MLDEKDDNQKIDYNKINVQSIIEEPNTAKNISDIYFKEFLKQRNGLDKFDCFDGTVMFDKDTCEWVTVYIPRFVRPLMELSSGLEDYSYEVRLRKDHGMVRIGDYDFAYYLY